MTSTIAILGGEGRLGSALSAHLTKQGHRVVSLDQEPNPERHEGTSFIECDFNSEESILSSVDVFSHRFGVVERTIQCLRYRPQGEPMSATMCREYASTVVGPALWLETVQQSQDPGRLRAIVHVTSVLGHLATEGQSASYHCVKAAQSALTRWQALNWGRFGTAVNAVAPGWITYEDRKFKVPTPDTAGTLVSDGALRSAHALRDPAAVGDVVALVEFLLFSKGVTGQVWSVDGGSSVLEALGVALKAREGEN